MAAAKKQPNCRVLHFGARWWSIPVKLNIDHVRLCYLDDDPPPESTLERLFGIPKQLFEESGVRQSLARKYIVDKVVAAIQATYGDFLDEHPFEFDDLVFVFSSITDEQDPEEPPGFSDRVMA